MNARWRRQQLTPDKWFVHFSLLWLLFPFPINQNCFNKAFPFVSVKFVILKKKTKKQLEVRPIHQAPHWAQLIHQLLSAETKGLTQMITRGEQLIISVRPSFNGIMLLWAAQCHWQAYDFRRISESMKGQKLCSSELAGVWFDGDSLPQHQYKEIDSQVVGENTTENYCYA